LAAAVAAGAAAGALRLPSREVSVGLQLEDNAIANSRNVSAASAARAPVQSFLFGSLAGCSDVMGKTFLQGYENHPFDAS
jgi:hypothetical protein